MTAATEPCDLSAVEARRLIGRKGLSPVELLESCLRRIEAVNPAVNAFVALDTDRARAAAREAEAAVMRGDHLGPLHGLPVGIKDNTEVAGVRTTYGSPIFRDFVPEADLGAVARIRAAGGVILGKTNVPEFSAGANTRNAVYGATGNPFDPSRSVAGSSGGSAAALATGMAPLALGTDTGGSIRIPAAFCGVVGLKPTWGRVSVAGVFPLAPSLDHVGPLARTVADARLLLDAIATGRPREPRAQWSAGLRGVRVAVAEELMPGRLAPSVTRALDDAAAALRALGAEVVPASAPATREPLLAYVPIQQAEALHTHRTAGLYPDRAEEYGADVRARLDLARSVGLEDYLEAQERRRALVEGLSKLFGDARLLLTPAVAGPPTRIGEEAGFRDLVLPTMTPQDLAGVPAVVLPAGRDEDGLPVGVQLTGAWGDEDGVLEAAEALESSLPPLGLAPVTPAEAQASGERGA
jgi:aspartyl-tRNA(Asn)/glutamyl-tRNA(Gln) amidotransferase subunit A